MFPDNFTPDFVSFLVCSDRCGAGMGRLNLWLLYVTITRAGCNYSIFSRWAGISALNPGT